MKWNEIDSTFQTKLVAVCNQGLHPCCPTKSSSSLLWKVVTMKEQRFGDKMDLRGSRTVNWITKWFCGCGESCIKAVTPISKRGDTYFSDRYFYLCMSTVLCPLYRYSQYLGMYCTCSVEKVFKIGFLNAWHKNKYSDQNVCFSFTLGAL